MTSHRKAARWGAAALLAGSLALATTALAPTAGAASLSPAFTCNHYGCGDPVANDCTTGAYIVLAETAFGSTVNMWWSPKCATNWVQYDVTDTQYDYLASITGSTGQTAGVDSNGVAGWEYSNMVQSPGSASMCVERIPPGGTGGPSSCFTQSA